MYPSVSSRSDLPNTRRLSSCSLSDIRSVIQSKGACLAEPHSCADMSGACCLGQQLVAAGVVCASPPPEETCLEQAMCTGSQAECPAFMNKPDGQPCAVGGDTGVAGTCNSGRCRHLHDNVCEAYGMVGCTITGLECMRSCATARGETCRPLSRSCLAPAGSWNINPTGPSNCAAAADGEFCASEADHLGTCSGSTLGCVACATPGCGSLEDMDGDDESYICDYSVLATTPCSEPCGGGQQVRL